MCLSLSIAGKRDAARRGSTFQCYGCKVGRLLSILFLSHRKLVVRPKTKPMVVQIEKKKQTNNETQLLGPSL